MRDRRVERTRKLLHEALMSLVLEKKYESITVQEILDRADVGRSTFYMHYSDKDALLSGGFENLKEFLKSAQATAKARGGKTYEKIIGFSLPMFEHASEYRRVIRALTGSGAEAVVRRHIHELLSAIVSQGVKEQAQRQKDSPQPVSAELLTYFLVSSYTSVLTWWLNSRNPQSAEEIDAAYRRLVLPCLSSIFG